MHSERHAASNVDVVVVTHNSLAHIGPCLSSIDAGGSVVLVDNDSSDSTLDLVQRDFPGVKIVRAGGNLGYAKAMNLGFRSTCSEFVVLSNSDVVYFPGEVAKTVSFMAAHPRVGITGMQQIFPNGMWQRSYGDLPGIWSGIKDATGISSLHNWRRRLAWPRKIDRHPKHVSYVDGGVLIVRRAAFEQIGGFDEDFYFYSDESDLCARLRRAGWGVVFFPLAQVVHVRGGSVQMDPSERFLRYMVESQIRLARKHTGATRTKIYSRLEMLLNRRLSVCWRLLILLSKEKATALEAERRVRLYDAYARLWEEYIRKGDCLGTSTAL